MPTSTPTTASATGSTPSRSVDPSRSGSLHHPKTRPTRLLNPPPADGPMSVLGSRSGPGPGIIQEGQTCIAPSGCRSLRQRLPAARSRSSQRPALSPRCPASRRRSPSRSASPLRPSSRPGLPRSRSRADRSRSTAAPPPCPTTATTATGRCARSRRPAHRTPQGGGDQDRAGQEHVPRAQGQNGPDQGYDYGTHFLFQGHEHSSPGTSPASTWTPTPSIASP